MWRYRNRAWGGVGDGVSAVRGAHCGRKPWVWDQRWIWLSVPLWINSHSRETCENSLHSSYLCSSSLHILLRLLRLFWPAGLIFPFSPLFKYLPLILVHLSNTLWCNWQVKPLMSQVCTHCSIGCCEIVGLNGDNTVNVMMFTGTWQLDFMFYTHGG